MSAYTGSREELIAALEAVRLAIDLPAPATSRDHEIFRALLEERASSAAIALRSMLSRHSTSELMWDVEWLVQRLGVLPVNSYRQVGEAVTQVTTTPS